MPRVRKKKVHSSLTEPGDLFYFTISRKHHADLLIRLIHDHINIDVFFRGVLEAYISQDSDFMKYWLRYKDKLVDEPNLNPKMQYKTGLYPKIVEEGKRNYIVGQSTKKDLELTSKELESIFDEFERK